MPPTEYWLEFHGGRLTLFYTLPLKTPVAIHGKATLEVFDPEYFVAFTFPKKKAVTLSDAPAGCTAEYHPPRMLDATTMAKLSAIPVDQHDLPPELQDAAAGLANLISLDCPGGTGGASGDPFEAVMAGGGKGDGGTTVPSPPATPQAAPSSDPAATGNLTAADIAAKPGGSPAAPAAPAPTQPAEPPTLIISENDGAAAAAPPATAVPAIGDAATSGESRFAVMGAVGLAAALLAAIAVAGFFLQRTLKRAR